MPTQWTMYWQAGCAWVSVTVASSPLTVNCPVMVTVKVETVVGSVEKWAVPSIVPEALMLTCWIESVRAPGVCVTVVGLFCTATLLQVLPGNKVTSVWYVPPTESSGVLDPPPPPQPGKRATR